MSTKRLALSKGLLMFYSQPPHTCLHLPVGQHQTWNLPDPQPVAPRPGPTTRGQRQALGPLRPTTSPGIHEPSSSCHEPWPTHQCVSTSFGIHTTSHAKTWPWPPTAIGLHMRQDLAANLVRSQPPTSRAPTVVTMPQQKGP